jgi:hypothetical protein
MTSATIWYCFLARFDRFPDRSDHRPCWTRIETLQQSGTVSLPDSITSLLDPIVAPLNKNRNPCDDICNDLVLFPCSILSSPRWTRIETRVMTSTTIWYCFPARFDRRPVEQESKPVWWHPQRFGVVSLLDSIASQLQHHLRPWMVTWSRTMLQMRRLLLVHNIRLGKTIFRNSEKLERQFARLVGGKHHP